MIFEQPHIYAALIEWETGDGWPTAEELAGMEKEVAGMKDLTRRYERCLNEAASNENLRHLRPSNLQQSNAVSAQDAKGDSLPRSARLRQELTRNATKTTAVVSTSSMVKWDDLKNS